MKVHRIVLAIALVTFGVAADLILRREPGIGLFLLAATGIGLIVMFARPKPWGIVLLAAALVVMAFTIFRANEMLLALNLMVAAGLTVLGASFGRSGDPLTTQLRAWVHRGVKVMTSLPEGVRSVLPPVKRPSTRSAAIVARTAAIAGVALVLFGGILMSADPVFAQIVTRPFQGMPDVGSFAHHAAFIVVATVAAGTVVAYAGRNLAVIQGRPISLGFSLGPWEWTAVIAVVSVLFASFVLVQFPSLFGGHSRVLDEIGLTYADYARSGFFQMILAAALTLGLLAIAWVSGASGSLAFRVAGITLVALDLVVLISAFRRLGLYEDQFGWTYMRLFGHVFILWLAVLLICVGIALALGGVRWLAFAALAAVLVAVVGVNLLNPDAFIATRNLERTAEGGVDVSYLGILSDDAVPAVVAALPTLGELQRASLIESLSAHECNQPDEGWLSWNLARERAIEAFAPYC